MSELLAPEGMKLSWVYKPGGTSPALASAPKAALDAKPMPGTGAGVGDGAAGNRSMDTRSMPCHSSQHL